MSEPLYDLLTITGETFVREEIDCAAKTFIACTFDNCTYVNTNNASFSHCEWIGTWPLGNLDDEGVHL